MSEETMKQNQDRRLKPMQGGDSINTDNNSTNNQPQKCPRCESLNTKFCYYNNYSLSQPRYFCKTCRRYWTQGGTLRNVPVGGGCRKGKRAKTSAASSSSSENSRPQVSQPQTIVSAANSGNGSLGLRSKELGNSLVSPSMGCFYSGGGFLNSLAAIQSLSAPQNFGLNQQQPVNNPAPDLGISTSNLNLLHGFNAAVSPFGSQLHQRQFYANQQQNWQQALMANTNPTVSDTALWSISTTTTTAAGNSNISAASGGSFPLNPTDNEWHDLPGYGPPP